jgi:hypothetical protein
MHGHGSIVETVGTFSGPSFRGRPIKFTPERIQQIKNLVERGKSREDIAELVGVTVGSLAVTCSKLGVSLRRRMVNNGVRLLHPTRPVSGDGSTAYVHIRMAPSQSEEEAAPLTSKHEVADPEVGTPSQEQPQADKMASAQFTVRMEYKGVECTTELALTPDMIEHLALEAELRNLRMGELIRDLILSTVKNDLFQQVYGA